MLLDDKHGRDALFAAGHQPDFWIAKPIELPGSRPLRFEQGEDLGSRLAEWPVDHCLKVLCFYHADDPAALKTDQIARLTAAFEAARKVGRDLLIEIICSKHGAVDDTTMARALTELYDAGLKPDWWKLESQTPAGWSAIDAVIADRDPYCRGVLVLGLDAPMDALTAALAIAKRAKSVRGFAVGRTIFAEAAKAWFAGTASEEETVSAMAQKFGALVAAWEEAK
jgi:5-dehydro-2-deoxygluconokinase